MPKRGSHESMVTGFAWFDKKQWQRLAELAADKDALDDSFEEWQRNAERSFRDLERQGLRIEKINVNVDELASWCKERGVPLNSEARSQYVAFVLRRRDTDASRG